jgi:hypothetical protein
MAGEAVFAAGELSREMYFLVHGTVEVSNAAGRRLTLLEDGAYFGELALLANVQRSASVTTLTVCDICVFTSADLAAVLDDFPDAEPRMRARALRRMAQLQRESEAVEASTKGMRRRSAANNAGAVWVDMPGQQPGMPVYNPIAQQQQQQPNQNQYGGQVYMNPMMYPAQEQQPAVSGYPVQMTVIAPRAAHLQEYQTEQRALYPSPVGTPASPASPVWQVQPPAQPRASDAGLDFTLQQSRASYASSGQSRPSQASSGGGDHAPQPHYAHG